MTSDQGKKPKIPLHQDLGICIYYCPTQLGVQIWSCARAIKFFVKTPQCHTNHVTL